MRTNLRYIVANNASELEASVKMLPFKVEIKSIYAQAGKVFCWFTVMDDQSTTAIDLQKSLQESSQNKPRRKKSKKNVE